MQTDDPRRSPTISVIALPLRSVVIWGHVILAFLSLFIFLNYLDLSHFPWWSRRASVWLVLMAAPALLPYAISAGYCWQLYTWQGTGPSRTRAGLFLGLLVLGAALVNAVFLGAFGTVEGFAVFELLVAQAWAYVWGAQWILNVI